MKRNSKYISVILLSIAFLQFAPTKNVNAATVVTPPNINVYQKDNKAKIELGVDIADSDILWKTGMEASDKLPNLAQGGHGNGNQSFTTTNKSSGNRSLMLQDTVTNKNGNYYWAPATYSLLSGWNSSTMYLPDGSRLALAMKVKTGAGNRNQLNLYMNTTYDDRGQFRNQNGKWVTNTNGVIKFKKDVDFTKGAPNTIEVYSDNGKIALDESEAFIIITSTNNNYQWGLTQYKWSNLEQKFILMTNVYKSGSCPSQKIVNQKFSKDSPVLFARDRNAGFETRNLEKNTDWTTISSSRTLTNPYYSFSKTGVDLRCTWLTDGNIYIDDVKLGYASQVEVFRDGVSLGKNYNYDLLDSGATDKAKPNAPTNINVNSNNTISWGSSTDNGTKYKYTAKVYSNKGTVSKLAPTKEITINSGIAGYSIVIDKNKTTIPTNKITTKNLTYNVNNVSGDYYVHIAAVDNAGNISDVKHIFVDKTKPEITTTYSPVSTSKWIKGDMLITVTGTDLGSGIKNIILPNGAVVNNTKGGNTFTQTYLIKDNGNYDFKVTDYNDNTQTKRISFSNNGSEELNFDNTAPIITTDYNEINEWTNKPIKVGINAADNQSGVQNITLPDGQIIDDNKVTYSVEENAKLTFKSRDKVGNESIKEVNVNNIDSTKPNKVSIEGVESEKWYNSSVNIIAKDNGTSGASGIKEIKYRIRNKETHKIIKEWETYINGVSSIDVEGILTVDFEAISNSGMESDISSVDIKIDKSNPTVEVLKSENSNWTKDSIVLSIEGSDDLSGIKSIKLPDGNLVTNTNKIDYKVTNNAVLNFEIIDNANNIQEQQVIINNIDRNAPEISINKVGNAKGYTNKNLDLEVVAKDSQSGVESIILPDGTIIEGDSAKYTISSNNKYIFKSIDKVGNIETKIVNIGPNGDFDVIIDKSAPKIEITPNIKEWTNKDVILSIKATDNGSGFLKLRLPDGTWTTSNDTSYKVNSNGHYTFVTIDKLGNEETTYYEVNNIDKEPPLATIEENITDWTTNNVIMSVSTMDSQSGIKSIQLPNGTWVNKNKVSYETNHNGIYSYVIEDMAGNQKTYTFNVSNVDKEEPAAPLISCDSNWTNLDKVRVTLNSLKDTQSGTKNIIYRLSGATSTGWLVYTDTLTIENEGITKIEAKVINNVDVESEVVTKEVKIDREVPINNDIIIHKK